MKDRQILYLVNGENEGEGYWKVGLSSKINPLVENKNFIECYRKELIGGDYSEKVLNAIQINIKSLTNDCIQDGYILDQPKDGISFDLPLTVIEEIYDFWLNLYKDIGLFEKVLALLIIRNKLHFSNPSILKGLKGFTADWATKIEKLHNYRPPSTRNHLSKEPMWMDQQN